VALLPYFADNVLDIGPKGLGFLRAAQPMGAILMSVILIYWPMNRNAGRNLLLSVAGFGLCIIGFAYSHSFILSMALMAISGMLDNVSVVIRSTILQLLTPDNMRGRVSAVNSIFIGSSNEIGAFESGIAAKLMGYIPSVIFGGIMTVAVVGTSGIVAPKLRKLDLTSLKGEEEANKAVA
jgi:MFS family permease